MESGTTTVRNLGLVLAGLIALPLAIWRGWVAQRQADTAKHNLLNMRYQQGAEMLGSEVLSVRRGGIYALQHLAGEYPKQYHIQVMQLLCAFVRHPPVGAMDKTSHVPGDPNELRSDVEEAMASISACHTRQDRFERAVVYRLDLRGVHLSGADLFKARLSRANLSCATLAEARLIGADLAGAEFARANLAGAVLSGADLSSAGFEHADLSGTQLDSANLSRARLYRANLSKARITNANLVGAHLSSANLAGALLHESDLSNTRLQGGNFAGAALIQANLAGAILSRTNLAGAGLDGANLLGADLSNADLSGASLGAVTMHIQQVNREPFRQTILTQLTQAQLDSARSNPKKPPKLDGAMDAETGRPLVWRGKPPNGQA